MTDSPFPVLVERLRDLAADPAAVTDADLVARFLRNRDPVAFEALVVHGDFLLSQTLSEIAVFPIRKRV